MQRHALRATTLALLVGLSTAAGAQSKFEGMITVRLVSTRDAVQGIYSVKGDLVRMDLESNTGKVAYTIARGAGQPAAMVMPSQRMYMEIPQSTVTAATRDAAAGKKVADVRMTGKKETIAGYECEHMIVTSDQGSAFDLCVTKELGTFTMMGNPMASGGATTPWQRAVGGNFFPLKVQQVGGDVAFEVTKIEKKKLDPALFTIPEGFQKIDMGRMGRPPA